MENEVIISLRQNKIILTFEREESAKSFYEAMKDEGKIGFLDKRSKELSSSNPTPAKPEPAKSDHVCRNQVGTLDSSVSETGGGFIRASPFVCKGIKRDKNG